MLIRCIPGDDYNFLDLLFSAQHAAISNRSGECLGAEMSDAFSYEVKQDEMEARNIGVRGVPFFVVDDKLKRV